MYPQRKGIPDRWGDYSNFKGVIKECHILPCKTPLKEDLFTYGTSDGILREDQNFTPDNFCQMVEQNLQSSLEFVIDFTNTSRYYNCRDFQIRGIKYIKIECVGKQVPSQDVYKRFHNAVEKCLQVITPQGVIAVHCTHGLNRSGFLVCNFLMNKYGYSADESVQIFNEARGHEIERAEYIDKLRRDKYSAPGSNNFEFLERPVDAIATDSIAAPASMDQHSRSLKLKRKVRKPNHQSPKKHRSSGKQQQQQQQQPYREHHSRYKHNPSFDPQPHHRYYKSYRYTEEHASYHPQERYHRNIEQPHYEPRTRRPYHDSCPPEYEYPRPPYPPAPREHHQDPYYRFPPSHMPPHAWGPPAHHPMGSYRVDPGQQRPIKYHSKQGECRAYPGVPYIKH